ncbi:MAG: hypothetical protein AABX38_04055 [Candidatus Micrarchaeota archaeon]
MKSIILILIVILFSGCTISELEKQIETGDSISIPTPVNSSTTKNLSGTSIQCTDSDGGINYAVKGTAKRGSELGTDYCFSSSSKIVREYYCTSNGAIGSQNYTCSNICSDGKCSSSSTSSVSTDNSCSGSSDCGYKQRCISGKCQTVECTNDAQCSGCKRCSNYACISCGRGPSGCYC